MFAADQRSPGGDACNRIGPVAALFFGIANDQAEPISIAGICCANNALATALGFGVYVNWLCFHLLFSRLRPRSTIRSCVNNCSILGALVNSCCRFFGRFSSRFCPFATLV